MVNDCCKNIKTNHDWLQEDADFYKIASHNKNVLIEDVAKTFLPSRYLGWNLKMIYDSI